EPAIVLFENRFKNKHITTLQLLYDLRFIFHHAHALFMRAKGIELITYGSAKRTLSDRSISLHLPVFRFLKSEHQSKDALYNIHHHFLKFLNSDFDWLSVQSFPIRLFPCQIDQ